MRQNFTVLLFSLTMFISAALMFSLQPMIGKMLLPRIGGAPAGWIVAMAFFQVMLLAGYFLAHALSRFTARQQALLYLVGLGIGIVVMPISIDNIGNDTLDGAAVFMLLLKKVALPFVAISATASTIQRLFTISGHKNAKDPYFLYAASNLGSLIGLAAYPFVLEPYYGLLMQSRFWLYGYTVLICATAFCLFISRGKSDQAETIVFQETVPLDARQKWLWLLLAFFPSSLLLGVTTHITTAIFSAPMLWTLPLGLYLLTFVIAFSRRPLVSLSTVARIQPFIVLLALGSMIVMQPSTITVSWYAVFAHVFFFTVIALMCHLRLAATRPHHDPRHLTTYYLMLSIGGALGGMFNAFIAPFIFKTVFEYPLIMVLSLLMNPLLHAAYTVRARTFLAFSGVCLVLVMVIFSGTLFDTMSQHQMLAAFSLIIAVSVLAANHPRSALACGMTLIIIHQCLPIDIIAKERNFYGILKVEENELAIDGKIYKTRTLQHGTTNHGMQVIDPILEKTPVSYYVKGTPIGHVFDAIKPDKALVMGLGAGVMNCLASEKTAMSFIEIDPSVVDIAQKHFTYLSACPHKAKTQIYIGDGRLELNKLNDKFDVIMLDAFTSDAIPLHLLTLEAMAGYLEKLSRNGIIVFHISNRYFNLAPVLAKTADALELKNRFTIFIPEHISEFALPSVWIAVARSDADFAALDAMKKDWLPVPPLSGQKIWTDDWNYLLGTLKSKSLKDMGLSE